MKGIIFLMVLAIIMAGENITAVSESINIESTKLPIINHLVLLTIQITNSKFFLLELLIMQSFKFLKLEIKCEKKRAKVVKDDAATQKCQAQIKKCAQNSDCEPCCAKEGAKGACAPMDKKCNCYKK